MKIKLFVVTNSSMLRHRYDSVQALRFFAALMVVITHSIFYASDRLGAGQITWGIGSRGVDIFFVISGFVMIISSRHLIGKPFGWLQFFVHRCARIVPMYWLATTFKLLVMIFAGSLVLHATLDMQNVVGSYFFIPYLKQAGKIEPLLGVGWTLVFEMFFYTVFTVALMFRTNVYIFCGVVMGVLSALSLFRTDFDSPAWFLCNSVVMEFWLGMLIGYLALAGLLLQRWYAGVLMLLAIAMLLLIPTGAEQNRLIVAGLPALLLVYSAVSIDRYIRVPDFILFVGAASYSLYLLHPLVVPAVPELLNKLDLHILILSIVLSIIVAITTAAIIYQYIELPVSNYLKNQTARLFRENNDNVQHFKCEKHSP